MGGGSEAHYWADLQDFYKNKENNILWKEEWTSVVTKMSSSDGIPQMVPFEGRGELSGSLSKRQDACCLGTPLFLVTKPYRENK